jgi:hypothetical protein
MEHLTVTQATFAFSLRRGGADGAHNTSCIGELRNESSISLSCKPESPQFPNPRSEDGALLLRR